MGRGTFGKAGFIPAPTADEPGDSEPKSIMKNSNDNRPSLDQARRKTIPVSVGGVLIGNGNPVVVQSMTSTDTHDVPKTIRQIRGLKKAGCELIRVAIPDEAAIPALKEIVDRSPSRSLRISISIFD